MGCLWGEGGIFFVGIEFLGFVFVRVSFLWIFEELELENSWVFLFMIFFLRNI